MRKNSSSIPVTAVTSPHYVFNTETDRRLAEIGDRVRRLDSYTAARMNEIRTHSTATRTLTNKKKRETQCLNIEKTLELQQRIIEGLK